MGGSRNKHRFIGTQLGGVLYRVKERAGHMSMTSYRESEGLAPVNATVDARLIAPPYLLKYSTKTYLVIVLG